MDPNFNINLSIDKDEKKDETPTIIDTVKEMTSNETNTTLMVAVVSHLILNTLKKS